MSILTIMIIKRKDIKVMRTHTNTKSFMLQKSIKNTLIPKFTIIAMILMTITVTIMKATILIAVIAQMTSTRVKGPCKKERISTITIKVMEAMLMIIIMIMIMSTNMIMKHME